MAITLKAIAEHIGGHLVGDPDAEVTHVCSPESPRSGGLCVVWAPKTVESCRLSAATACVTPVDVEIAGISCIQVANPRAALVDLLQLLHPRRKPRAGIEARAVVSRTARCADGVFIAAGAHIGDGARLDSGVEIHSNVVVGEGVAIGEDSVIFANATVHAGTIIGRRVVIHSGAVIGSDGFGYIPAGDGSVRKIPQIGIVEIEDDVEIGAGTTIDRGTIGRTLIRRGAKIDNLVQIAHNCEIGEHSILAGQVGLAGSVTIGDRSVLAGQVGVADHVTTAADVRIAAQSGVAEDLASGYWVGSPAMPGDRALRAIALANRLPEFHDEIRKLRKRCAALEEEVRGLQTTIEATENE